VVILISQNVSGFPIQKNNSSKDCVEINSPIIALWLTWTRGQKDQKGGLFV